MAKSWLVLLFIALVRFGCDAQTEALPATNNFHNRFLFVVETSSDIKKMAPAAKECVIELLGSGVGAQMNEGDSFGLWTFSFDLYAGDFPLQFWSTNAAATLTNRVGAYLKAQKFDKPADLEPVWRPLFTVMRASPSLMIVLITSGTQPIRGTPFDGEINAYFTENQKEFRKTKTPFVTILLAQNGKIIRHSVSPALGDVKIPKIPPLPRPAPAVVRTNAPAPPRSTQALVIGKGGAKLVDPTTADALVEKMKEEQEAKLAAAKQAAENASQNETPTEKSAEVTQTRAAAPAGTPSSGLAVAQVKTSAQPVEAQTEKALPVAPTESSPPAPSAETKVVETAVKPVSTPVEQPSVAPVHSESPSPAKEINPAPKTSVAQPADAPMTATAVRVPLVAIIVIFVCVAGGIGFLLGRQSTRRSGPTLISEALERQNKK